MEPGHSAMDAGVRTGVLTSKPNAPRQSSGLSLKGSSDFEDLEIGREEVRKQINPWKS